MIRQPSSPRGQASEPGTARVILAFVLGLILLALPAAGQYFGKNRIQYRDFDWKIYHSPHFDVYYYETEAHQLQRAVSMAESAYDELSRDFDYQIQDPTPLIIYQTHSAFRQNNIIVNGVPEGAQAFAVPSRFRMVLPLDMPDNQLLALVKHELTHIFQYHILFRGKLGAGLRGSPPQWFMEGMASYFGDDEGPADKKFMIDAVVNDQLPSVQVQGGGFFAYRYGHALFDFIEERWGREAILDLIYEFRNTLGSRVGRAIERTFRMDVEDFDAEFRRWARQRYLPELLETGEPGDFGKPFRLDKPVSGQEMSPEAAPSGDLVAAITTDKGEIDISLFDAQKRRRIRNLTKGLDHQIREINTSTTREVGGDLAFSPDGNFIAAFGRREAGRALILIDVLNGGIKKIIEMDIEQQLSPTWSPDGRTVAFSGNLGGTFDIFTIDLDTLEITNLTNDEVHDAAPAYSPDGRWLAYTAWVGEYSQLFRLDLHDPARRYQMTEGEYNNKEPAWSPDGQRIYFTSDRSGVDNIFGLDLEHGRVSQYTNAVTGCDRPTVLASPDGVERLVYTGYWKGRFDLYTTEIEEPLSEPEAVEIASEPAVMADLERFEPDIEVAIDESSIDPYNGKKFFLEGIQNSFGIDTNQIFVGFVEAGWTDYLGDRRIYARVAAVDTFSDFDVAYINMSRRWQWSANLFDSRYFGVLTDPNTGLIEDRQEIYAITGGQFSLIYPISFKNRIVFSGGYFLREYKSTVTVPTRDGIGNIVVIGERKDDFPQISVAFVSDSTIYNQWGPLSGHRVRLSANYAPDLDESGTLHQTITVDARKYFPLGRRSNFALRLLGQSSTGEVPFLFFVGGLDNLRGLDFRELNGSRGFVANVELRFPLIDQLAFPGFALQGIRGVLFFDIGGTWYPGFQDFELYDSDNDQLGDAIASYGFGFSVRLFGFNLNWDFAQVTRFGDDYCRILGRLSDCPPEIFGDLPGVERLDGFKTSFWIGTRF